jgi:hypothetical protein
LRILSFSDLHLEFRPGALDAFDRLDGYLLVLAGDIDLPQNASFVLDPTGKTAHAKSRLTSRPIFAPPNPRTAA